MPNISVNVSGYGPAQRWYPDAVITDNGGPFDMTSSVAYARYVGHTDRDITAGELYGYIHGVAAVAGGGGESLNWAEFAIAEGAEPTSAFQASLNLTIRKAVSVNTEALNAGAGTVNVAKAISGFVIPRDIGLWIIAATAYQTTNMALRFPSGADVFGYVRSRAACRPSLNLNTPLAFTTGAPVAALVPYLSFKDAS